MGSILGYIKGSNIRISLDLNPTQWAIICYQDVGPTGMAPGNIYFGMVGFGPLLITLVIDDLSW